jgi:hypothetical protein
MRKLLLLLVLALPALAQQPYHLELEANAAAPFPWLAKFGTVDLHVYPGGVYADTVWLNGFTKNGQSAITVMNPIGRMYVELPIGEIASAVRHLSNNQANIEAGIAGKLVPPPLSAPMKGKVVGIDATRYRLQYGPDAWIDVWTTTAIPKNPQLDTIVSQLIAAVSPSTAVSAKKIPGAPVYVELNFRRFKKLPILRLKKLSFDNEGESDNLSLGRIYMKAPLLENIWK